MYIKIKKMADYYLKLATYELKKKSIRSVMYDPKLHQQLKYYENELDPEDNMGDAQEYGKTKNFDIRAFKQIQDPVQARLYAHRRLQPLGVGSSRATYVYSPKYVLKMAINEAGMYQNEIEASISQSGEYNDIIARVIDAAPNNIWLISELVQPIQAIQAMDDFGDDEVYHDTHQEIKQFNQHSPINWHSMQQGLDPDYQSDYEDEDDEGNPPPTYKDFLQTAPQPIVTEVQNKINMAKNMINDYGLRMGDISVPSNWGRTADGRLVILDYGFDDYAWSAYYQNRNNNGLKRWELDYEDEKFPIDQKFNS